MILQAHSLCKSFGSLCLFSDLSLSIAPGESIAILGRSGSGKTTLLHILGALESPDAGEIYIGGKLLSPQNAAHLRLTQIGFIFQAFHLLEDFSVLENILMPARIARRSVAIHHLLQDLDLMNHQQMKCSLLSGGEKQRVAIARALCNDPPLILADEPTGNLDSLNAQKMGELLLHCVRKKHKSLILVTHDPDLAALCDRRYLLKEGHLDCLFSSPMLK
jgi:lipoprotein-releasing system ATP-binding protein